jgi:DNA-binding NarL/FixJ family response regulator
VLLVDASALGAGNAGVYASIQDRLPELKVLFIGTAAEAASFSVETLRVVTRLSTVGFLYRDGTIDRVIDGVRLVASGAFVCETDVMRALLSDLATRGSKAVREAPAPVPELSAREREVLALVASGLSNREIGSRLYVSEGTVKAHVSHVMSKLGLERRTELVRFAMSRGLDAAA